MYGYAWPQMYDMVYGCTRESVSIDVEYSGKVFDTDLRVVAGDL